MDYFEQSKVTTCYLRHSSVEQGQRSDRDGKYVCIISGISCDLETQKLTSECWLKTCVRLI